MPYVYLAIAIVGEVIGTSLLKTSDGMSKLWPTCASILAYAVTFYFLSLTLRTIPTGIAYAIWSGVGIVLITAIGWVFFKQALDAAAVFGLGLILAGVLVIQLLSKVSVH
jgi:small multidrug resistance pump